jgi:predicted Zn-dependent peptidase
MITATPAIQSHTLDNGMAVHIEPIASVASAALAWLVPVGSATAPANRQGQSAMLCELLERGAGQRDARQHSDALDRLGVHIGTSVSPHHISLGGTLLGSRMTDALPLVCDMVTCPLLPESAMDAVRSLCLQTLASLDDDPQEKVGLQLREQHLPPPFNRSGYGKVDAIKSMTLKHLRDAWNEHCRPNRSILAIAGAVDPDAIVKQLNKLLAKWTGTSAEPKATGPAARGTVHIQHESAQVHIAMAFDAPRESDPHSAIERLAINILGGSTSGRLFTEVRQKRSLCYSVSATYNAGRDEGAVSLYAGTTPERAQETLDISIEQIHRLREGVTAEEFHRAVTGLKSRLIMQGESTPARAKSIARDVFRIGRARELDEIARQIDSVTIDQLNDYLRNRDFGRFTVASIGPVELAVCAS